MAQCCNQSPPSPRIPLLSVSLFVFISHCPSLFVLHLPPLCLTLSCLRASICLQSFPPSPPTPPPLPSPSSQISSLPLCLFPSYSFISPSLTRAVTGAVINHESRALSGTTEPRGAPLPSLPLSFICLGLLPLTNLFQLISPPK